MKILVTGGAGYIGSITLRTLLDAGHECVVLDTLENGYAAAIDQRAQFVQGSVGDPDAVEKAAQGCDAVMHLAGYINVGESVQNPEKYFANNLDASRVLLSVAVDKLGITSLVFSSTAAIYGQPEMLPISEESPKHPINPYGESKWQFEQLLDTYAEKGLRSIRFRYFNAAGAFPDGSLGEAHIPETHLIPNIIKAFSTSHDSCTIFGNDFDTPDGTCVRDYIHVCDLAQAHLLGLEALVRGEEGGSYNLGNGKGFSNLEVVTECGRALGLSDLQVKSRTNFGPRRAGDPATLIASAQAAEERFGWSPHYSSISEIVKHAVTWHNTHPTGY